LEDAIFLYKTTPLRGIPVEFCRNISYGETRMVGLPEGEKNLLIYLSTAVQYTNMMDSHRTMA